MNDIEKIVAANLKMRRRELGWTQRMLAEKLGYSEKAISKWENGGGMPPAILFPVLADVLGTSIDELMCEQTTIQYYLGIDGGGTKTEFLLTDREGTVLHRVILGGCNPNDIGVSTSLEILHAGILEVCGDLPRRKISVFAGIAGGITGDMPRRLSEFLARYRFGQVSHGSDAQNAVAVCLGDRDGVVMIMGTGSIAFAQRDGNLFRVGGYGQLFGDGGSGFNLGRDGILAALQDEDGSGVSTLLTELIREKCGSDQLLPCVGGFYKGGKRVLATYASLVFDAYGAGDEVAFRIVRSNMRSVADQIKACAKHLDSQVSISAVLCGGIATHQPQVLPLIREILNEEDQRITVSVCERSPVWGALWLAGMKEIKK